MRDKIEFPYRAPLTCMVQAKTAERIKELADKAKPEGAEAFGMQFCKLEDEFRNKFAKVVFAVLKDNLVLEAFEKHLVR